MDPGTGTEGHGQYETPCASRLLESGVPGKLWQTAAGLQLKRELGES